MKKSAQDVSHTVGLQWDRLQIVVSFDALVRPISDSTLAAHPPFAPSISPCCTLYFVASMYIHPLPLMGPSLFPFTCLPAWGMQANQDQGCDRIRGEPIAGYHRDPFPASVLGRLAACERVRGRVEGPIALESSHQLRGLRVVVTPYLVAYRW